MKAYTFEKCGKSILIEETTGFNFFYEFFIYST